MHKGYAFVQFTNPFDARSACLGEDGRTVLGQTLGKSQIFHTNLPSVWQPIYRLLIQQFLFAVSNGLSWGVLFKLEEAKSEIFFVRSSGFPDAAVFSKTLKILQISNEPSKALSIL
jgi:hypothetical protein